MKKEDLFEAIGQAEEPLLARSEKRKLPGGRWKGPLIAAACFGVVCIGGGTLLSYMGGSSGDAGHDEGAAYMFYDGPILPLTLAEESTGITATRDLTLDFSPYQRTEYTDLYGDTYTRYYSGLNAYDNYTLTNESNEDVTVTALYPFVGTFYDLDQENMNSPTQHFAAATVNGQAVESELLLGSDVDGWLNVYTDFYGDLTWENYQQLLTNGEYQDHARNMSDVLEIPVVVYEFSDISAPKEIEESVRSFNFTVSIPNEEGKSIPALILCGFNSGHRSTAVPGESKYSSGVDTWRIDDDTRSIAVLNDDISFSLSAWYRDSENNQDVYFDGLEITTRRTEMTLGEYLTFCVENGFYGSQFEIQYGHEGGRLSDLFARAVMDWAVQYGSGENQLESRAVTMLGDLFSQCYHAERIFYLSFEVTIPAGESVTIETTQYKEGSYSYRCEDRRSEGLRGYDTLTTAGSSLTFTQQTASLAGWEFIQIGRQNYGFDPKTGITEVQLDLNEPWYYIEVKKATE